MFQWLVPGWRDYCVWLHQTVEYNIDRYRVDRYRANTSEINIFIECVVIVCNKYIQSASDFLGVSIFSSGSVGWFFLLPRMQGW